MMAWRKVLQIIGGITLVLGVMAVLVYGALWAFFNLQGFPF